MTNKQKMTRENPKLTERGYKKLKETLMDANVQTYMRQLQKQWSISHGLDVKRGLAYAKAQRLKTHGKQK